MEFINRIRIMHKLFGDGEGHCKECSNLGYYETSRRYYKCKVYGVSSSDATDWRCNAICCGMKNKEYHGNPVYKSYSDVKPEEQVEGQLSLFEEGD